MWYLTALPFLPKGIAWQWGSATTFRPDDAEGLRIGFYFSSFERGMPKRDALKVLERVLTETPISWLTPGRKKWTIDLSALHNFKPKTVPEAAGDLSCLEWLTGRVEIEPEIESDVHGMRDGPSSHETTVAFYIDPANVGELRRGDTMGEPVEIQESISRFREDHPDPLAVGFLMMKFGQTPAHDKFVTAIRASFSAHGITVLRADDKQYHDDLFPNILTYIHGCGIGIAVFERIEANEFNPNVSLEVGYMLAMRKEVCLLKDKTLKTLPTDLVGKLYKPFDILKPGKTIPPQIDKWVSDKRLSKKP